MRNCAWHFLLLAFAGSYSFSQTTTLHTQTNVVLVPALVKDAGGEPIYGLKAKDFIVEDDGVAQTVHLDEESDDQPLSLVIAVQRGRRASYEFPRMRGLSTMLAPLGAQGQNRIALIEFDHNVQVIRPFTKDPSLIDDDLQAFRSP